MLHKSLANSLKDVDIKSGVVCFYASSFNVVDDGNDLCVPGCYTKTIAQQGPNSNHPRIKFLYQHDTTAILGVPQVLKEDGFGLYVEAKIVPTALGSDCLLLYAANCITEHSIGYEVVQASWDRTKAVRLLEELKLYEVSACTWGMNPETPTVGIKSLTQPEHLSAMADQAARLDSLLHSGNLRSDALCETLERELKALHAALAPAHSEPDTPYTIQGVIDSMNDLKSRLGVKGATGSATWPLGARDAAWDGGAAHKRIVEWATKSDGSVDTGKLQSVHFYSPEGDAAENVSQYKLLYCDVDGGKVTAMPKAIFACAGSHGVDATTGISDSDKAAIRKKITAYYARMAKQFDDDTIVAPWDKNDGGKAATQMATRMVKGSGGDVAVSADGTHAAYTGTHTHSHKAMGSQGGDVMHAHEHSHKGNANHGHDHTAVDGTETASDATAEQESGEPVKARRERRTYKQHLAARQRKTFAEHYQEQQCCDLLRDWQDVVLAAFTSAVYDAFQIGDEPASDISDALDGLKDAVTDWVDEAVKYGLSGYLDAQGYDGGTEYQMQSGSSSPYYSGYMSRTPLAMPDAPAPLRKAGRQISGANRAVITDALDGMSEAMKAMKAHHGAIADLMTKTDPDAVRQDEDNTQGDDDSENGGDNINGPKSRLTSDPARRSAAVYPTRAATTHQTGTPLDLSAIVADLDALKGRLTAHAR